MAGGVGFLPNGSEDPNRSALSVLLKKSSDEVPLKGSLSLKGSPPNGSKRGEKCEQRGFIHQWPSATKTKSRLCFDLIHSMNCEDTYHRLFNMTVAAGKYYQCSHLIEQIEQILIPIDENNNKRQEGTQTIEGFEGVLGLKRVCWRLLSTAVVEHGYLGLKRVILKNESKQIGK